MSQIKSNIATLTDDLTSLKRRGRKAFAVLLDPDKLATQNIEDVVDCALNAGVTYFFVGGSLLINNEIHSIIPQIKALCDIPVILFPGSIQQIIPSADAIFFLSLISGRNADLLIGNHVVAAPMIRQTKLQVIPTGYMLIESGKMTTANYISNSFPIPYDKPDIAVCTAMAGEMLGLRVLYMDGGSGAQNIIPTEMIRAVANYVNIPIIIGGGIRSREEAISVWEAGAEVVVVGNALEKENGKELMMEIGAALREMNKLVD